MTPDMSLPTRIRTYNAASTALAVHSDHTLRELVDAATPIGAGIGGQSVLLEVGGTTVFVKRVQLTDLERRPEQLRSTANVFDMPPFCHYGVGIIGSPGFGAWRELAVHIMTTNWVLAAEYEGFPLLYHWRVLPGTMPLPQELADIDRAVAYWDGDIQVRRRIAALRDSSASIALFLEYIPQSLRGWLTAQIEAGDEDAERGCAMVERALAAGTTFMNSRGLLHLDAHFDNILTDGRHLYFGDFGLAVFSGFDLSPEEVAFFGRNQSYDRAYTASYLVNMLVANLYGVRWEDQEAHTALMHTLTESNRPDGIPRSAAAIIARHAPIAATMTAFIRAFQRVSRSAAYPDEEIRQLLGDRPFRCHGSTTASVSSAQRNDDSSDGAVE
jgi:hypothetical protein